MQDSYYRTKFLMPETTQNRKVSIGTMKEMDVYSWSGSVLAEKLFCDSTCGFVLLKQCLEQLE